MSISETHLPLYAYLHGLHHPDCEFMDGDLEERNTGEYPHSKLQNWRLGFWFRLMQRNANHG